MSPPSLRLTRLEMRPLRIPFTTTFRHAAAERSESSSVWVDAATSDGARGHGEGCPRGYVTGESIDSARAFLDAHRASIVRDIVDLETLGAWVSAHEPAIDSHPAAWCAIELAILHLVGQRLGVTVEQLLGLPALSGTYHYTAVLGDAQPETFHALARRYAAQGFTDFKVKLSGDTARDRHKLEVFRAWPSAELRVRADANNVWPTADEAIAALGDLDWPWFAVEEPTVPGEYAGLARVAASLDTRIVLDESLLRRAQLGALAAPASQWIVNVRVSKMGGLLRSLDVIRDAAARGIGIVVGAQVGETSLLTRAGLTAGQAAGRALVAQEGAFGTHLLARDVCDPPLMFGAGGALSVEGFPWLKAAGWGATFVAPRAEP